DTSRAQRDHAHRRTFSRPTADGGVRSAPGVKRPVRMNARTSGQTSAKRSYRSPWFIATYAQSSYRWPRLSQRKSKGPYALASFACDTMNGVGPATQTRATAV